jgi:hypothetical protein
METSRRPPTPYLVSLRWIMVAVIGALPALFIALVLGGQPFTRPDAIWIALPLVVGLADTVLVPAVGSTVRPLPYGVPPADARRISVRVLSTVTFLRLALAEAPALFGFVSSVAAGSLVPFAIGLAFAIPLLAWFVFPSTRVVDEIRGRLESGGVSSHLWEGLNAPGRNTQAPS